ncbi:MAG: MutS-related protein [Omnitrophica WOR_2 bacterium]
MPITKNRLARQKALQNQLNRMDRQIQRLGVYNNRFSWIRLAVVLAGGILAAAGAIYGSSWWAWSAFILMVVIFSIVVFFHRRLDRSTERFRFLAEITSLQLARMSLDWDHIPEPAFHTRTPASSLELDLDLTGRRSLHQLIDTSISLQGSQVLADWLSQADPDPERTAYRQKIVRELVPLARFRNRLLVDYRRVSKEPLNEERLLGWLEQEYPAARLRWGLPVAAVLVFLNLALFLLAGFAILPPYWVITFLLYIAFYFNNQSQLREFLDAIIDLDREIGKLQAVLIYLEKYPLTGRENLANLLAPFRDPKNSPSAQLRKIRLVTSAVGLRMNPVMALLVNFVLPWDFLFAVLAGRLREQACASLPPWLGVIHQLEGMISLANFAYLNPEYAFPELSTRSEPVFQAEALGHPLITPEKKVCNDFTVQKPGEIAIITGSNMAGKSTFIKTVGINLCLAYAGGPVDASRFHSTYFRLHTCIHITDSVTESFSYFYAEVKCLKSLLERLQSESAYPLLYLIDEIFRGTNNRERLIGSQAYVKALIGKNGCGLLATHDLELAGFARSDSRVSNFHFRDFVEDGRLQFDFRIRPGPSPTTNALKIMQLEGLPVETNEDLNPG